MQSVRFLTGFYGWVRPQGHPPLRVAQNTGEVAGFTPPYAEELQRMGYVEPVQAAPPVQTHRAMESPPAPAPRANPSARPRKGGGSA